MKYILANIRIPIEINDTGNTKPLLSRSSIEIFKCTELPPENPNYSKDIANKISSFLNGVSISNTHPPEPSADPDPATEPEPEPEPATEPEPEPEPIPVPQLTVLKEEIQQAGKRSQNISFKRYKKNNHRKSSKRRQASIQIEDVDFEEE